MNFQTDNLIILYYPTGAGGKFISNCLSLSKHAVSQNPDAVAIELNAAPALPQTLQSSYYANAGADWPDLSDFVFNRAVNILPNILCEIRSNAHFAEIQDLAMLCNSDYYQFKKRVATMSLPLSSNISSWVKHEYGCYQLFGVDNNEYLTKPNLITADRYSVITRLLSQGTSKFFIVAHKLDSLLGMKCRWPNAKILSLTNYTKFTALACQLKQLDNVPALALLPNTDAVFNIDNAIFSENTFIKSMYDLYAALKFDDFDKIEVNMREFYREYAALHFT